MSHKSKYLMKHVRKFQLSRAATIVVFRAILEARRSGTLVTREWCRPDSAHGCLLAVATAAALGAPDPSVLYRFLSADEDLLREEIAAVLGITDQTVRAIYVLWDTMTGTERRHFIAKLEDRCRELGREEERALRKAVLRMRVVRDDQVRDQEALLASVVREGSVAFAAAQA